MDIRVFESSNVFCVTYNSAATVGELLESLQRQPGAVALAVVVDNGSTDATVDVVEAYRERLDFPLELIRSRNDGFAAGVLRAGQHPRIDTRLPTLCINPDVVLAPAVLNEMLTLLRDESVAIVTAPLVRPDGQPDTASVRRLPTFGAAALYSLLGKLLPPRIRYNSQAQSLPASTRHLGHLEYMEIEATTGALMLVPSAFRNPAEGIFDTDYWMYGEDLQLCHDARRDGLKVVLPLLPASVHIKGASSGWPRSWTSNRAFHNAMYVYYKKNLSKSRAASRIVHTAIILRMLLSHAVGRLLHIGRSLGRTAAPRRVNAQ
jgi:N-acetylglucosaminyl-diphospho-decaprenol L-rhamnosyltransferase